MRVHWRRNLYLLWVAQFLVMLGMSFVMPFLPFYIRELGVRDFKAVARWNGAIFGVTFFTSSFCAPIWGVLGDRYGRKPMILRGLFGIALVVTLTGFARRVEDLFILRALQGILGGFMPPLMALVSASIPPEIVGSVMGFLQTSWIVGGILGPLFGGPLGDLMGYRHLFFVTGGMVFISAVLVAIFVKEEKDPPKEGNNYGLRDNLRYFFHSPELLSIVFSIFVLQTSIMLVEPVLPLFVQSLGVKKFVGTTTGAIFSSTGIVTAFAAPLWGRWGDKNGYKRTLAYCLLGSSLCFFPHFVVQSPLQLAMVRIALGMFSAGIGPSTQSLIALNVPQERRGGIYGMTSSGTLLGNVVGPFLGGVLASAIGIRPSFLLTAFMLLVVYILVWKTVNEPSSPRAN